MSRSLAVTVFALHGLSGFGCTAGSSPAIVGREGGAHGVTDGAPVDATRDMGRELHEDGGAPFLSDLVVTAASTMHGEAHVALEPAFSPRIHDYYVRCAAGSSVLTVAMTAGPGFMSVLLRPRSSPTVARQTLTETVDENEAIVAAATAGAAKTEYWIRCLPADFPELRISAHPDAGSPRPGYYLVGDFTPTTDGAYAMVLDGDGVPVWYARGIGRGMGDVDEVVAGAVSFISFDTPMPTFELHSLAPPRPWGATTYLRPTGSALDGHDLQVTTSGRFIVLSNPVETGFDLSGIAVPMGDGGVAAFGPDSSIQGCNLVEFDGASGATTWQWSGSQHLDPVKDSTLPGLGTFGATGPDGGLVADPFHCNSIDVDPANGNLLVSARNMDAVFYIDRSTGAILWKLGGTRYTKDNAAYVALVDPFYRQHDARLLPGWSGCAGGTGQVSMFDDESEKGSPARAVVYDVVVGAADAEGCGGGAAPGTATVAWQYQGAVNSTSIGSFRISSDGSRVIGWGFGAPNLVFSEVDVHGHDLLDFEFPDGNASYRAIKVPLTALDLGAMRSTAGRQ